MAKRKTPEYRRRAISNYRKTKDNVSVMLPLGTKDSIKQLTGLSVNAFINRAVANELHRVESEQKGY